MSAPAGRPPDGLPARAEAARDWITPDDLNVAPALLGLPLARPRQRLLAMAVDLALIAALSRLANGWLLLAAVVLLAGHLAAQRRGVRRGRRWLAAVLAVPLLVLGLQQAVSDLRHGRPAEQAEGNADVDAEGDADEAPAPGSRAARRAAAAELARAATAQATGAAASSPAALELAAAQVQVEALRSEVATLKARLAAQQAPQPGSGPDLAAWRRRIEHLADDLGLGYGWSILYFMLLPAWWGGRSPGKALLGLQVRELTGKPMTPMRCLKRYGGYAAGLATGGLGLMQLLWDPNRQAIQDKTAHTVVVDTRRPRRDAAD